MVHGCLVFYFFAFSLRLFDYSFIAAGPAGKADSLQKLFSTGVSLSLASDTYGTICRKDVIDAAPQDGATSTIPREQEMTCDSEINIFTDGEPDDLWSLIGIFATANSLNCLPEKYPIKAVFGGGGYDSHQADLTLRRYLEDLRENGILPREPIFSIRESVFPGPTTLRGEAIHFDDLGTAFDGSFTRQNMPPRGRDEVLQSTIQSLPNLSLILGQQSPTILALRPIFEWIVCWTESTGPPGAPSLGSPFYQERVAQMTWDAATCAELVNKFMSSQVIMYQGTYSFRSMGEFYQNYVESSAANVNVLRKAFTEGAKSFLVIDRHSMLTSKDFETHDISFTAASAKSTYKTFRSRGTLHRLLMHSISKWNDQILRPAVYSFFQIFHDDEHSSKLGQSIRFRFGAMQARAAEVARLTATFQRPWATQEKIIQFHASIRSLQRDVAQYLLDEHRDDSYISQATHNITLWAEIAPFKSTWVDVGDTLVPFLLQPGSNVVKDSLQRVNYQNVDSDEHYIWAAANSSSNSSVYFTSFADTKDIARQRSQRLSGEMDGFYSSALHTRCAFCRQQLSEDDAGLR